MSLIVLTPTRTIRTSRDSVSTVIAGRADGADERGSARRGRTGSFVGDRTFDADTGGTYGEACSTVGDGQDEGQGADNRRHAGRRRTVDGAGEPQETGLRLTVEE